jgi:serine/threonine protein kinase
MVQHFPVVPGGAIHFTFGTRIGPPSRNAGETYTVKGPSLQPNGSPRHSAPTPPQDVPLQFSPLANVQAYACKVIRRPLTEAQVNSEIQRIEKVSAKRNKWVVRLYTTWQEAQTTGPARFLVMEMADKSLEEHMDYLARSYDIWEGFSRWFGNDADWQVPFRDILNGLQYLHELGLVHRNLKPSNGTSGYSQRVLVVI